MAKGGGNLNAVGVVTMTDNNVETRLIRSDRQRQRLRQSMLDSLGKTGRRETEAKGARPASDNSPVMHLVRETYQRLFNKTPNIQIIHAGLECNLFKTVSGNGHGFYRANHHWSTLSG